MSKIHDVPYETVDPVHEDLDPNVLTGVDGTTHIAPEFAKAAAKEEAKEAKAAAKAEGEKSKVEDDKDSKAPKAPAAPTK